ncbi:MAG: hypothetical protein NZ750_06450 [Anaerolineae bacterium]|nr:hypothetical protein [Anaerolineae bacterium]MDW8171128.1 hypothetical protein [Anaerolineae bacterium]
MDGLETQYGEAIAFSALDATDGGPGQAAFESLGLRGHPTIVLFRADSTEVQRIVGIPDEDALRKLLDSLLSR